MFSICKQSHQPTGVEHAISCFFFNKTERSLITAGANILKVFRLIPDVDQKTRHERYSEFFPPKSKLECMAQYQLFGNIMALQSVTLANSPRDSLLIGFSDAKLSVVEYDPENHQLKTLSLHYFEEEDMKDGWTHFHHIPIVRADPENRCAVMTIFGKKLVILPFKRETSIDEGDSDIKPTLSSGLGGKSAILASYMIEVKDFMDKIDNIIDIQFLHGYYEPTLLILYEPLKTFPGRVAVRRDTCAMAAISINLQQKVHPVIWSVSNLPFDCIRAVPIKKPIGGTLIFAVNSLIYLNQSIPPYAVSVNSIAETSSSFPMKPQEDLKISFDCAQIGFLDDDTLVLSLKGGELFVLTLLADNMRYVRNFHFEKAAASVLTTCVCICENNFLFLGSRLGNSLLLRFTEKANEVITLDDSEEPGSKKARESKADDIGDIVSDSLTDFIASDVLDIRDPEELEVYGNQKQAGVQISSYIFEVCDSLLNIGPCGQISVGEPAFLSEEFQKNPDLNLELVTTSGFGKNGALCVLQRSIKPQIVTTFTLPGCFNMWTIKSGEDTHSFLILSQEESTMVLQTGQEINEIDNTGFSTHQPTVFAGNLGNNRFVVQVTTISVRLLQGAVQLQHVPMDLGSPIVQVSCADPYVSLMAADGQVITLMLREVRGSAKLVISKSTLSNTPMITTICMYKDTSGVFANKIPDEFTHIPQHFITDMSDLTTDTQNEEDLLYGDNDFKMPSLSGATPKPKVFYNWWKKYMTPAKPTYWLFVVRENSNMEIYSIPDFKLSFYVQNLCFGHKVLIDSLESVMLNVTTHINETQIQKDYQVKEISMVGMGANGSRPILFVRLDKHLYIYEVFRFYKGNLKLRFRRIKHEIMYQPNVAGVVDTENSDYFTLQEKISKIRYFDNIAGYNGVFICGASPYWIFLTKRGELRYHPMIIDGEVINFAPFNNVNCPEGFLYFNRKSELRIGILPTHLSYDAPWPVRKVPLRCTPHFVTYHLESKTYCLVTSLSEPSNSYYRFNGEDKELAVEDKHERFPYPHQESFSLMLFSPVSWDVIPNTKIDLDEWEHITCLRNVSLEYEGARSGLKGYIAVGTNYNYGEDITCRGRGNSTSDVVMSINYSSLMLLIFLIIGWYTSEIKIESVKLADAIYESWWYQKDILIQQIVHIIIMRSQRPLTLTIGSFKPMTTEVVTSILIYDVIEVVPEPGQPLTKNKFKEIYAKEQKGPVTALSQVKGFLISAVGQKIYIWQLKDNDLIGIAFIDTQVYTHQILTIKNLILIADVYQSISLLRFQDEYRTLSLVSRDLRACEVYGIEYMIDNSNIGFLMSDREKNITICMYQPEARESLGGLRLLRKADFHLGQAVTTFFRIKCKLGELGEDKKNMSGADRRHITMFATLDGGLGYIMPVLEKTYRRLLMLQNVMVTHGAHIGGLNPKGFRTFKSYRKMSNPARSIIDGELVWNFMQLSITEKIEVSKKIGTKLEELQDDLSDIQKLTNHF